MTDTNAFSVASSCATRREDFERMQANAEQTLRETRLRLALCSAGLAHVATTSLLNVRSTEYDRQFTQAQFLKALHDYEESERRST